MRGCVHRAQQGVSSLGREASQASWEHGARGAGGCGGELLGPGWAGEGRPGLPRTRLLAVPSDPGQARLSTCAASCGHSGQPSPTPQPTRVSGRLKSDGWGRIPFSEHGSCARSVIQSCPSLRPHGLQPTRLLRPWDSPGKNAGIGCHFLSQGVFPTQG